jgi:galactokinase
MVNTPSTLRVSAPGRVCLFGEHQDYLFLPVVPCAISLRIVVEGTQRADTMVHIALPDITSEDCFSLDDHVPYLRRHDYFRSVVNVLRKKGWTFSRGCDCTVRGDIPISAGTSSSSALTVSWVNFITQMSGQGKRLAPEEIAQIAYEAEVVEFKEHGGMMDQYAAALGGMIAIDFVPVFTITSIDVPLGTLVLGDSQDPKDTQSVLARVKGAVLSASHRITGFQPEFSLHTATPETVQRYSHKLAPEETQLLLATLHNRDITHQAREVLRTSPLDHRRLGMLLTEHQTVLRETLRISTPKIDRMIDAALCAGAYGAKINGSGGGGCMLAYAPEHPDRVARAVEDVGGKAYIVRADPGTRTEVIEEAL